MLPAASAVAAGALGVLLPELDATPARSADLELPAGDRVGLHGRHPARPDRAGRPACPGRRRPRLGAGGIRPEYFEDATLVDEAKRPTGTTFRVMVDVSE